MKFDYAYTFGLPQKLVWRWIKDANVLGKSITGCKSFTEIKPGVYHGIIDMGIGAISENYHLEVQRIQEKKPSFYRLHVNGSGNIGNIVARVDLYLREIPGACNLNIHAEARVDGALAVAGEHVINGFAAKGIERFFQRLEKEIKRSIHTTRKGR